MLLDGVGSDLLADALVPGLRAAARPPLRVRAGDFLRPAGVRFEHGREDAESFARTWLDAEALEREVLVRRGTPTCRRCGTRPRTAPRGADPSRCRRARCCSSTACSCSAAA